MQNKLWPWGQKSFVSCVWFRKKLPQEVNIDTICNGMYNCVEIIRDVLLIIVSFREAVFVSKKRQRIYSLFFLVLFFVSLLPMAAIAANAKSVNLASGAVYTGEVALNNVPHGKGEATWPDGSKYAGEFFNGMLHGNGVFRYANGDVYDGNFEYGFRSGKGKITFANGDFYEGQWQADMMHGKGKYTFNAPDPSKPTKNDVYNGEWRYNMMHGKGSYKFANGKTTNGYWVKNSYRGTKLTSTLKTEIGELD